MSSSKKWDRLKTLEYRQAYVGSQLSVGIPFQIKALMKSRGITQQMLAERTGMAQSRISALLAAGKSRPNIETLRRLAEAFDCGLAVRFVPFSELQAWSDAFDPETFQVPRFDDDCEADAPQADGGSARGIVNLCNRLASPSAVNAAYKAPSLSGAIC